MTQAGQAHEPAATRPVVSFARVITINRAFRASRLQSCCTFCCLCRQLVHLSTMQAVKGNSFFTAASESLCEQALGVFGADTLRRGPEAENRSHLNLLSTHLHSTGWLYRKYVLSSALSSMYLQQHLHRDNKVDRLSISNSPI